MSKGCREQYQIAGFSVRSSSAGVELRRLPLASDRSRQLGTRLRRRAEGVGAVRWPWGAESRCRRWPDVPRAPSARIPATGQRRRHPAPAPSGSFRSCCGASGSRPGSWTVEVHTPRRPARASPHAWSTWRRADRGAEARPSGGHCAARSVFLHVEALSAGRFPRRPAPVRGPEGSRAAGETRPSSTTRLLDHAVPAGGSMPRLEPLAGHRRAVRRQ